MTFITGQTIYEDVLSLDADNNPISGATFETVLFKDGMLYTGQTVSILLSDSIRGIFSASWSADTSGSYQLYVKNNITNVIFLADAVRIDDTDGSAQNIYIGL